MIDEICVRDLALIHEATIQPAEGLTVLTGETGAGKTALLSSIKLLIGERADATMVREGASALEVTGRLFERGGDPDGLVVRRRVSVEGRGRVDLDGDMVSVRELADRVGAGVDLCGQHEHQRLLVASSHVEVLDAWVGEEASEALATYRRALERASEARHELVRIQDLSRSTAERLDAARFTLRRIDEVDPHPGEYEELEERLSRVEHGEALMSAALVAHGLLQDDEGALDVLAEASRALGDASRYDASLLELVDILDSSIAEVADVARNLRSYADDLDFDPEEFERLQMRLSGFEGLKRAYGPRMADVLARRDEAREIIEAAADGGERLAAAEKDLAEAEAELVRAAAALGRVRRAAAPRLAAAITDQMGHLEMGTAELEVSVSDLSRQEWGASGANRVEFLYRPAAGLTARPLRRIASGGEVSRVMLACKVVLEAADPCETLIFDEVDAGVGGATAVALAEVLARLAKTHQVIVVTHLAQVAVVADCHYLVRKSAGEVPETTLTLIEGEDRVAEVARMLSGNTDEASLDLARHMLSSHPVG